MENIAAYIDHTQLKPETSREKIDQVIQEAITYQFYSVCINPYWVPYCAEMLKNTPVKVCAVIGFPLGATSPFIKARETEQAIKDGAQEVDMVINVGELKSGNDQAVREDIEYVISATGKEILTKVIIETALLTENEKVRACHLAMEAGAGYVKTSTGFSGGGATVEDVSLMRRTVGTDIGVKASGGIRDLRSAIDMIEAGATRIGASAGVSIVQANKEA